MSPLDGIRHNLDIHEEPMHGAGNAYWMVDIFRTAKEQGLGALLTGQLGNAGVSWEGGLRFHPWFVQLRFLGFRKTALNMVARYLPERFMILQRALKWSLRQWSDFSAISPALARRLRLLDLARMDEGLTGFRPPKNPLEMRMQVLLPDSLLGAIYAETGAAWDMEIRDPTGDVRVIEYCLSVPDRIYLDPKHKERRCLIRKAMAGIMPDEVRLNRIRGRQAADIVPRLRASEQEVEDCLNRMHRSLKAREYIDLNLMRQVWNEARLRASPDIYRKVVLILTRGLMAGLFVMNRHR